MELLEFERVVKRPIKTLWTDDEISRLLAFVDKSASPLGHPGGPFWRKKDLGSWSIPKGLIGSGETP